MASVRRRTEEARRPARLGGAAAWQAVQSRAMPRRRGGNTETGPRAHRHGRGFSGREISKRVTVLGVWQRHAPTAAGNSSTSPLRNANSAPS